MSLSLSNNDHALTNPPLYWGKINTCQLGTITKSYDLTSYYDHIALEQRDGSFMVDPNVKTAPREA